MAPSPSNLLTTPLLLALLTTLLLALTLRLLAILPRAHHLPSTPLTSSPLTTLRRPQLHPRKSRTAHLLIVLGSGGHTHEMFNLLRGLDTCRWSHRTYVVSSGDAFSVRRAVAFEEGLEAARRQTVQSEREEDGGDNLKGVGKECYSIEIVPRARRVHQGLWSTPFSALRSLGAAVRVLLFPTHPFTPLRTTAAHSSSTSLHTTTTLPDLILTNGPATAVLVLLAAFLLRFFNVRGAQTRGLCRTLYVESFARVKTLSLSGRLVVGWVDRFVVQWEALEGYAGRAEYWGVLVG